GPVIVAGSAGVPVVARPRGGGGRSVVRGGLGHLPQARGGGGVADLRGLFVHRAVGPAGRAAGGGEPVAGALGRLGAGARTAPRESPVRRLRPAVRDGRRPVGRFAVGTRPGEPGDRRP